MEVRSFQGLQPTVRQDRLRKKVVVMTDKLVHIAAVKVE